MPNREIYSLRRGRKMTLERSQLLADVTMICITAICLIANVVTGNWQAVLGFGTAVVMSIDVLIAHRITRYWWRKYCRAMGWKDDEEGYVE